MYELSEEQWDKIKDSLLGKVGDRGRSATENRLFVEGVSGLPVMVDGNARYLPAMASGTRCISVSYAGLKSVFGK